MPAGKTYVKIASQTLSGSVSSVTFSNLPQNYTDLLIVGSIISSSTSNDTRVQFNGDTGSNYSMTRMYGEASAAGSDRSTNATSMHLGRNSTTVTPNTFHIMNYSNGSTFKTALGRSGFATGIILANVGLWRSTAAITSITFLVTGGDTFSSGSTLTIYGIEAAKSPYAEGGDKVYSTGTHWVHEFYYSGTFVPRQNLTCDYLVVAGGGGGGSGNATPGGGGGAGGLRSTVTATGGGGSLESALSLTGFTAYTVTVGAGGSGGHSSFDTRGIAGSNSVFSTITSTGGGFGAENQISGGSGGSGGGGAGGVNTSGGTRTASPVQGNNGGGGLASGNQPSGGGGGAGAAGSAGSGSTGGAGGAGVAVAITGSSVTYAGGGGGSTYNGGTAGAGGAGGGGAGAYNAAGSPNGTSNTGGGGGGTGGNGGTRYAAGNGGSGIVIVRYAI